MKTAPRPDLLGALGGAAAGESGLLQAGAPATLPSAAVLRPVPELVHTELGLREGTLVVSFIKQDMRIRGPRKLFPHLTNANSSAL